METLEQYKERTKLRSTFEESPALLREVQWCNYIRSYKVFTPIVDEVEVEDIVNSSRVRGATTEFMNNLVAFHTTWLEDNEGKTLLIALNKDSGDPFYGKKTDSLYQGLNDRIGKMDLKQAFRLIKKSTGEGDDKVTHLYIASL